MPRLYMSSLESQQQGISNVQRKKYARNIHVANLPRKKTKTTMESNADMEGIQMPHDDVMVITIKAGGAIVQRMMVDTGSSCDVLFFFVFLQMEIDMES